MRIKYFIAAVAFAFYMHAHGQDASGFPENATLEECVSFALKNRANIKISNIDEEIGERDIASSLSGWFPSVGMAANYNYNMKIPSAIIGDQIIQMGSKNVSGVTIQADQQILNPQLIQATKSAHEIRNLNTQNTEYAKINTIVEVSKAYYDILTSNKQLEIIEANIERIKKQLEDATSRYEVGLVDQIDYQRARIALSNSEVDLKKTKELLKYKYEYLKELVGLNPQDAISLDLQDADIDGEVLLDLGDFAQAQNRIEYQMLETQQRLQKLNTKFSKAAYMPVMSAFVNYGWDWRGESFPKQFDVTTPRSVLGLNFAFNIFDGNKKLQSLRKSQLVETRLDWDMVQLKNRINSEYQLAKATYYAHTEDWATAKENLKISQEIYDVIKLQYDTGIKTYLELMTADTDLKTSQVHYLNALFAVLSSKIDLQRALGDIHPSTYN